MREIIVLRKTCAKLLAPLMDISILETILHQPQFSCLGETPAKWMASELQGELRKNMFGEFNEKGKPTHSPNIRWNLMILLSHSVRTGKPYLRLLHITVCEKVCGQTRQVIIFLIKKSNTLCRAFTSGSALGQGSQKRNGP